MKGERGNYVILSEIPTGLLNDLPSEDQDAIRAVLGKRVRLIGYDDDGRAELEFADSGGTIHFIYVSQNCIKPTL